MDNILGQVKAQATSSITIGATDSTLQDQLLRHIRNGSSKANSSWLSIRGKHDKRNQQGQLEPLPGERRQVFWHGGTLFVLDEPSFTAELDVDGHVGYDTSGETEIKHRPMTVRCFGHSNKPIVELFKYLQADALQSEELEVIKITLGDTKSEMRDKRSLNSIDLEPKMMKYITQVVEDFFHPDSRALYRATSRPYRKGFLLYGPPGTGKTSLSVAIASHVGHPLVTITLRGMDDTDLENAFQDLPLPCVVLLEDVDASSADVGNRRQPSKAKARVTDEQTEVVDAHVAANAIEHAVGQLRSEMNLGFKGISEEQKRLNKLVEDRGSYAEDNGNYRTNNHSHVHRKAIPFPSAEELSLKPPPTKSVTLSGLLNVIDGAAAVERRLLIMTTNHPENIDDALKRPGRCDDHFEIGFATKNTAEQTFKRIFGLDPCKIHHIDAINRFARAFKEQFPETSKISTASLAKYCALHRNRPVEAVKNFPRWLEVGDEIFVYNIEARKTETDPTKINVPQGFDHTLLNVSAPDFVAPVIEEDDFDDIPEIQRSIFNPLRWVLGTKSAPQRSLGAQPEHLPLKSPGDDVASEIDPDRTKMELSLVSFDLSLGSFTYAQIQPQNSQQPRLISNWGFDGE
jgi:chaperone BCS1